MIPYTYVQIIHNMPHVENINNLMNSKYLKSKKYAMLFKTLHADGSESITHLRYSNNLNELQNIANGFISWYNYPSNQSKNIQGYITNII